MTLGVVKFYNAVKGWGMIQCAHGDVFIHHTNIDKPGFRSLKKDAIVKFDVEETARGLKAVKVSEVNQKEPA